MQTTGTVLLNARGCNINGYDCFVNLSKSTNEYQYLIRNPAIGSTAIYDSNKTCPIPGYTQSVEITSNSKISPICLLFKNWGYTIYFLTNTRINTGTVTLAYWAKTNSYFSSTTNPTSNPGTIIGAGMEVDIAKARLFYRHYAKQVLYLSGTTLTTKSYTTDTSVWHHYVVETIENRILFFQDGTKILDVNIPDSTVVGSNIPCFGTYGKDLYLDDIVFIDGEALWTSNFTPPSTYLLDSEYEVPVSNLKRRNIIAANIDKKIIIPDEPLKQY